MGGEGGLGEEGERGWKEGCPTRCAANHGVAVVFCFVSSGSARFLFQNQISLAIHLPDGSRKNSPCVACLLPPSPTPHIFT